ncbi:acetyltransferase [Dysgonomonas sp. 216]|uniref:lysophospholipid acyltransferase family protein n=1 Tax=Dysgonomonas sp. 216 TaxID=2302934 RepID=UPI0013D7EA4D|nr:lysophospholipid acyltransferase family protein [Dysgonomonas sp. 216]NDW17552.1 acetyltransferase [Dysgonomonas sp. 216]
MFTKITYYLTFAWMYLHAMLPFRLLYILSDILYLLVYYVVGYRVKVVRKNLKNSFPDKAHKELRQIERNFYHHLCDYFVETMKLLHISDKQMQERFVFTNPEIIRERMKDKSAILYLGHYGNWEWITSITLVLDKNDPDIVAAQVYRPLKSKAFDDIFLKLRKRFKSVGIPKNHTLRAIINFRNEGKRSIIGMISDQTPSWANIHYWTKFLNQDTPVFTGAERIAKQTGFAVYYLDVQKTGRGKYTGTFELLSETPKSEPENAITEMYIRKFENTILRNPAYWLWSHNRWKHKKSDFVK